ncbi:MAG: DUF1822 family protein [Cyanobacteria bacterium P01_A01_bin.84]
MKTTQIPLLVPLGIEAHQIASQFALEQSTPEKGKKVYLNTLAVCAVHTYLKWLQIETDLSFGENWEPTLAAVFDNADLEIPGVGKLECYPILPGETNFTLSLKTNTSIIGYILVKFDEYLDKAQLLGFIPALKTFPLSEQIPIANLQPLENLLDYIANIFHHIIE